MKFWLGVCESVDQFHFLLLCCFVHERQPPHTVLYPLSSQDSESCSSSSLVVSAVVSWRSAVSTCFASFTQSPGMDSSFTASVFYKLLQYTHCTCHFPCGKNLAAGWIWEMWLLGHNVYTFEILIDKLLRVVSIYIPTNNKIGGLFAIVSILHCQPFSFLLSW